MNQLIENPEDFVGAMAEQVKHAYNFEFGNSKQDVILKFNFLSWCILLLTFIVIYKSIGSHGFMWFLIIVITQMWNNNYKTQ